MKSTSATCAQIINSAAAEIYASFVEPDRLTQFWLKSASGPLSVDHPVAWEFMVPGAHETVTATRLVQAKEIELDWSDGIRVCISVEEAQGYCRVVIEVSGFEKGDISAATNAIEGFTIVLADLKLLLETGISPGLVAEKARLIAMAEPAK